MQKNIAQKFLIAIFKGYKRFISPLLPAGTCRFHPTCSSYAMEAVANHGALKGSLMAIWRLMRCGPWTSGGHDPVPPKEDKKGEHCSCNH